MSQHYLRFNMNELARLAAEAVGAKCCVKVEKCPDGFYNKSFLLTMEDGRQVIGKLPNPNAGQAHYTTASEVATMDFVSISQNWSAMVVFNESYVGKKCLGYPNSPSVCMELQGRR